MDHPVAIAALRWIVLLPLAGAAINLLAGAWLQRRFGRRIISAIGCGVVIAAFILGVRATIALTALAPDSRFMLDDLWRWLEVGGLRLDIAFWLDPLSAVMVLIVTGVGGLIHIYSVGYMRDDPAYWRFFGWLNLFTFAMLTLVLADNALLMFVGWECVGLCSYALIGFWYQVGANAAAGDKAFIVNRVGDAAFIVAILALFGALSAVGHPTLNFRELARLAPILASRSGYLGMPLLTFVTLMFFLGATGKSAQIPLHVWLPDAMAGPTPVSALIHAATMVTAGVYMVARLNFLYSLAPATLEFVATVGALTAFFAATVAITQNDIKRVLAWSTISQLGYMFVAVGVGAYAAGVFHLLTHAFFKACLFLGAGAVIHALGGEQDLRAMGGLRRTMPVTFLACFAATLAIVGAPPFAGFMSKDEIIWDVWSRGHRALWAVLWIGAGITAFYMFRQFYLTFFGEYRGPADRERHPHDAPPTMAFALVALALLSVVGGFVQLPEFIAPFAPFAHFLDPVFASAATRDPLAAGVHDRAREAFFAALSLIIVGAGWLLADLAYRREILALDGGAAFANGLFYRLSLNKYYVDEIYAVLIVGPYLWAARAAAWIDSHLIDALVNLTARSAVLAAWLAGLFDRRVVDGRVNAASEATLGAGARLRRIQTGSINGYLYGMLAAIMLILLIRAFMRA